MDEPECFYLIESLFLSCIMKCVSRIFIAKQLSFAFIAPTFSSNLINVFLDGNESSIMVENSPLE